MSPAKSGPVEDRRGAVVASTGNRNGWPLGAALASDLGVGGDARPVMEGELLNLSRKFFIPAGTSNGLGGGFACLRELAHKLHGVLEGGAVLPSGGASFLAAFSLRRVLSAAINSSWNKQFCCSITVSSQPTFHSQSPFRTDDAPQTLYSQVLTLFCLILRLWLCASLKD